MSNTPYFTNDKLGARLRVVMDEDGPWFAAKDVCRFLGFSSGSLTCILSGNCVLTDSPINNQEYAIISEASLYRLVFLSRRSKAEAYLDWIMNDVIPKASRLNDEPVEDNSLVLFTNKVLKAKIRSVTIAGEPWFFANDICDCLDLKNVSKTVSYLDDDEKMQLDMSITNSYTGSNGGSAPLIVSEPGMYSLILKSRKPEAKAFKRWVTHEVLPSIRRTGEYRIRKEYARRIDYLRKRTSDAWNEVDKLHEQFSKFPITYPGKYYTLWTTPYETGDKDDCIAELFTLSDKMGYGVKVTEDHQYAWHRDVWKRRDASKSIVVH